MSKDKISIIVLLVLLIYLFFSMNNFAFCATPKIVNKLNDAFEDVEQWILKLSTPAAAVSLGVGFLMKKFSFGDEEKMRISKKIIRGTLTSYGLILATDIILAAIKSFI